MEKVSYRHVEPDGRFQFHAGDGKEISVTADKPFGTDDPGLIVWLETQPFLKRAKSGKADDGGEA